MLAGADLTNRTQRVSREAKHTLKSGCRQCLGFDAILYAFNSVTNLLISHFEMAIYQLKYHALIDEAT